MNAFKNGNTWKSIISIVLTIIMLLLVYIAVPLKTQMAETVKMVISNKETARMELATKANEIRNGFNILALKVNTNEQRWVSIEKNIDEIKEMIREMK